MKTRKYTGRRSFEAEIRVVVQDLIARGVFKNPDHQDHKAQLVLRALGYDPSDPPAGYSRATIKTVFRLEWSRWQEAITKKFTGDSDSAASNDAFQRAEIGAEIRD